MANMKHGRALWERLLDRLQILGRFTLGYSGGIDSRFLAHAAIHARVPVELVHGTGPHIAPDETAYAARWAEGRKLPLRLLYIDPLQLPAVAQGGKGRCYVCKRHLFEQMAAVTIGPFCDGSNASDASLFRPGQPRLQAASRPCRPGSGGEGVGRDPGHRRTVEEGPQDPGRVMIPGRRERGCTRGW